MCHGDANGLFLNDGQGVFTQDLGVWGDDSSLGYTLRQMQYQYTKRAIWADADGNGLYDLLILNDRYADHKFFLNKGPSATDVNYEQITTGPLVTTRQNAKSAVFFDYDRDGILDVYVINSGEEALAGIHSAKGDKNALFKGLGSGQYRAITLGPLVERRDASMAAQVIDFDNDGSLDLYVVNHVAGAEWGDILYRGVQGGSFKLVKEYEFLVSFDSYTNRGGMYDISLVDLNNDGKLDLTVGTEKKNQFLLSQGSKLHGQFSMDDINNGIITDSTFRADVAETRRMLWGDYDADGWLDLFTVNFDAANCLYRNKGNNANGQWLGMEKVSGQIVTTDATYASGGSTNGAWADVDNDGDLDLFITGGPGKTNTLYRNKGTSSGTHQGFEKLSSDAATTTAPPSDGGSTCAIFGDYNNDGCALAIARC